MNINISDYIISQKLNDEEMLLYSTYTTSILTMENSLYKDIFIDRNFDSHPDECEALIEMGFLFDGGLEDQADELESVRKQIMNDGDSVNSVTIAPTMKCNARCFYCFEHGALQDTMTPETADAVADFLINRSPSGEIHISWFGGEPLMAADVIDRINNRLIEAGISVTSSITTNGILIDEDMVKRFSNWNIERVQITLDGLGETYNRIKNYNFSIENPFEIIMQNISLVLTSGISVHLRVNYKSTDYKTVKEAMDYLHERFGKHENFYLYGAPLDLPHIKGYSEFDEDEGNIFLNVLNDSMKRGYENDELNYDSIRLSKTFDPKLGELMLAPFPANCMMVNKNRFVIDDQGLLYKCQKHLGKPKFSCGDVFSGPVENEVYKFYVCEKLHDENCRKCRMLPICQGGCNANRLLHGNKFACPPSKSIVEKLVRSYYKYLIENQGKEEN